MSNFLCVCATIMFIIHAACPSGQISCSNGTGMNCVYNIDVCDGMPECVDENGVAEDEYILCEGTTVHISME